MRWRFTHPPTALWMERSRVLGFIMIAHLRRPTTQAAGCRAIHPTHLGQDSTQIEVEFMQLSGLPVESKFGSSRGTIFPRTLPTGIRSLKPGALRRQIFQSRV